ncbi:MAG: UDP-N-acetylglucosamine 4,6-dehydratase (inverting) [Flavobacteriaceae bacterium]|nr:UDP-N-acetylglucosamine 4,6-dehydratase (inverting) [Flavobacteriaceae bacterium]
MKKIFITGGSGTVGSSFIEKNINEYKIYSYSRNEKSQVALKRAFPKVEIILGSVEDEFNLENSVRLVKPDIIIHAAALKHVDSAEKQPIEMVKSNIVGSKNIIEVSNKINVPITIGISTDKACNPNNLYGYSKKIMEKMFIEANNEKNIFCCTRFGNVAGSNGSVIPFWLNCKDQGKALPLTDLNMTRLMLNREEVSAIIKRCIYECEQKSGGFILSKTMKKVFLKDLANEISDKIELIGLRPGEELMESLISEEELIFTRIDKDYIFILDRENTDRTTRLKSPLSSSNATKMTNSELRNLVEYVKENNTNTMTY